MKLTKEYLKKMNAYSADANAKKKETQIKILKYGIKLLKLQKEV